MLSIEHCRRNRERLATAVGISGLSGDTAYSAAVTELRNYPVGAGPTPRVSFEDSEIAAFAFAQGLFPEKSGGECLNQDRGALTALLASGFELLSDVAPELEELVRLVTTDILFVRSTRVGGGSGSHLPGLIGVTPGSGWDALEVAKCLVHEATHLNVFLSDMIFGLYLEPADRLDREECLVLSAARIGEMRPLDKAFHSALVAVPVMYLESRVGEHEVRDAFLPSIRDCTRGLRENQDRFTPYGRALLGELESFVRELDYGVVDESFQLDDQECCV